MALQEISPEWQWYNDVDGVFRIAMPLDWRMNDMFHYGSPQTGNSAQQKQEIWINFRSSESDLKDTIFSLSIRIRMVREIPASMMAKIAPDLGFDRRVYRLNDSQEWLGWIERGYHIDLQSHVLLNTFWAGSAYRSFGNPHPEPLPVIEQQSRLAVMQRIIDSFEVLRDAPDLPVS